MNVPVELELLSECKNADVVLDGVAVVLLVHADGDDPRRLLEAVVRVQVVLAGDDAQLPGLVVVAAVSRGENVTLKINESVKPDFCKRMNKLELYGHLVKDCSSTEVEVPCLH